jgi:hypothetical protein
MSAIIRKKSPRAPVFPLEEALEKTLKVYEREKLHAAPTDVVAQDIGYKNAINGSALQTVASLRYWGVMERPKEGFLAVSKDFERYRFAPDEDQKRRVLIRFLKTPPLFAELLEKYSDGLPSDATLLYELIERGFNPGTAENAIVALRKSVDFVNFYASPNDDPAIAFQSSGLASDFEAAPVGPDKDVSPAGQVLRQANSVLFTREVNQSEGERLPIRLTGGRRAWLILPEVLYEADKMRIKAQLDLVLTVEDDDVDG